MLDWRMLIHKLCYINWWQWSQNSVTSSVKSKMLPSNWRPCQMGTPLIQSTPDSALAQGLSCTATRSEVERINVCLHVKNTHTEIPWFISEIATTGVTVHSCFLPLGSSCELLWPWVKYRHKDRVKWTVSHNSDHCTLLIFCDLLQALTWCRAHIKFNVCLVSS